MSGTINGNNNFFYNSQPIQQHGRPSRATQTTTQSTQTTQKPAQNKPLNNIQTLNQALQTLGANHSSNISQTQQKKENISPEVQAQLNEMNSDLEGTGFTAQVINGEICLVDPEGNTVEGEMLDEILEAGGNPEKEIDMMMDYSTDGNESLNKTEYQTFITNYLQDATGIDKITPEIQQIIDKSFTSLAGNDAEINKDELRKNAENAFNQLAEEVSILLDSQEE